MLLAHPAVLQDLADRYEELEAGARAGLLDPPARQRLRDVAYTLCISTGTSDVDAALVAARRRLPGARVEDDSLLAEPAVSGAAGGAPGARKDHRAERQSKPDLYEQARKVGIKGRSSMTKGQLIRALRDR